MSLLRRVLTGSLLAGPAILAVALSAALPALNVCVGADDKPKVPSEKVPASATALQASLKSNLDYARHWIARDDFASLRQTAGDLTLLADALDRESDDKSWRGSVASLGEAIAELARAAGRKNKAEATAAADKIDARLTAVSWNGGGRHSQNARPKVGGRGMMHLVDVLLADAKTSIAVGDLAAAKDHARVLSVASRLLSNEHADDEGWTKHALGMSDDALRAAGEDDPQQFRAALTAATKRCADCHADYR